MIAKALTPKELARRWRCRPTTVRAMIARGELVAFQVNGHQRIAPEVIEAAEAGPRAVRPAKRRKREVVPQEIADIIARA